MTASALVTLAQVRSFLAGTTEMTLTCAADDAARYHFIATVAQRFGYARLSRSDKGTLRQYLIRMTGYSRQQLTRLLQRWRESGRLEQRYVAPTAGFRRRYAAQGVQLLAEIDALHGTLFGPATCVLLRRAFTGYGEARYARVAPHWFERESNYGRVSPISVHYRPRLIRCWRKSTDCCARWTGR